MLADLPYTIRAGRKSYSFLTCTVILGLSIVLTGLFTLLVEPAFWAALLTFLIILGIFLIWLGSFKIVLGKDRLIYNTLFSKNNEVLFANIKRIEVRNGPGPEYVRTGAWSRLNIYDADRFSKRPLIINVLVFNKEDLTTFINILTTKKADIKLDARTQRIKEGKFKWEQHFWWGKDSETQSCLNHFFHAPGSEDFFDRFN